MISNDAALIISCHFTFSSLFTFIHPCIYQLHPQLRHVETDAFAVNYCDCCIRCVVFGVLVVILVIVVIVVVVVISTNALLATVAITD